MNRKKTESALKQELKRLAPVSLWQELDGSYSLFGEYHIIPMNEEFVVEQSDKDNLRFGSKRAAAVWCIADHCGDRQLAQQIKTADRYLQKLITDVNMRKSVPGSVEFISMVRLKTDQKQHRIQELKLEIDRCARLARYYQRTLK